MAGQKLSQLNFYNGQYDRTLQGKESSEFTSAGLSSAQNLMSSNNGELRKRLGTRFLLNLPSNAVSVPYRFLDDDLILVFYDLGLEVFQYTDAGVVPFIEPGTIEKLEQVWTSNTTNGYTVGSPTSGVQANPYNSQLYKAFNTPPTARPMKYDQVGAPWGVSNPTADDWFITFQSPTDVIPNKFDIRWINAARGNPSTDQTDSFDNCVIQYSDDGDNWTSVPTRIQGALGGAGPYHTKYHYGLNSAERTEFYSIYSAIPNVQTAHKHWRLWFNQRVMPAVRGQSSWYGIVCSIVLQSGTEHKVYSTDIPAEKLQSIKYSQFSNDMKIAVEGINPKSFSMTNNAITWNNAWAPGAPTDFWTVNGFPAAVKHFQNRLWFGGFDITPTRVVASKFGDYTRFSQETTTIQYTDALDLTCNEIKSKIHNIDGGFNVLYCYSQDGISFVDGGQTGLIATNQNIQFHLKNKQPAGNMTPTVKDDVMLYVSADGQKLYSTDYDLLVQRFNVMDLAQNAQDVVQKKIMELHYIDRSSRQIYGLLGNGEMFAFLYQKSVLNGFFPLNTNGTISDIATIKYGRDYKLLLTVQRDGQYYLEEKLDQGVYLPTSNLDATDESRKWNTWDNLENNIAMDCYKYFENKVDMTGTFTDNTMTLSEGGVDLSAYIGKQIRVYADQQNWAVLNLLSSNDYYSFVGSAQSQTNYLRLTNFFGSVGTTLAEVGVATQLSVNEKTIVLNAVQTDSSTFYPGILLELTGTGIIADDNSYNGECTCKMQAGSNIYEMTGTFSGVIGSGTATLNFNGHNHVEGQNTYQDFRFLAPQAQVYTVNTNSFFVSIDSRRGTLPSFLKIQLPFETIDVPFNQDTEVAVISNGRYYGRIKTNENGNILLENPVFYAIYGLPYRGRGVIKVQTPYESMKTVRQIHLSVIDTMHLAVGTHPDYLQSIENIADDTHYDLTNITLNQTYRIVPDDQAEFEKNIIIQSDEGLPFTLLRLDAVINYGNMGGN